MDNQTGINVLNIYLKTLSLALFICKLLIFTLFMAKVAIASQYDLKLIVDFSKLGQGKTEPNWLTPITNPANAEQLFVATEHGDIFLLEKADAGEHATVLRLQQALFKESFISLSAFTLHPSFNRPEDSGYATLFTAHIAKTSQQQRTVILSSLMDIDAGTEFSFETVITAWHYDFEKRKFDREKPREILRIPIKSQDGGINNLSFDPHQKDWGKDYGLLYFSVSANDELKDYPLYSGVLLRINPQQYGARNYTIPEDNPFIEDPKINDEIVVMGLGEIEHYFWSKKEYAEIYVQHHNQQTYWLSQTKVGENLMLAVAEHPEHILRQQTSPLSAILLYEGRDLMDFRAKFISVFSKNNKWLIEAFTPLNIDPPISVELTGTKNFASATIVNIQNDGNQELVIFDKQNASLYRLHDTQMQQDDDEVLESSVTESSDGWYVFLIGVLVLLVLSIIFYSRKLILVGRGHLQDTNQLRIRYEPNLKSVLLYKSNKNVPLKSFSIDQILACEVMLNGKVLVSVDAQVNDLTEHLFSNQIEKDLRELFSDEHYRKLLDNETRTIELLLRDKDQSFTACLYYRKGRLRTTGAKFFEVVDMVIDLCWKISSQLNSEVTEQRIVHSQQEVEMATRYFTPPAKKLSDASNKKQIVEESPESEVDAIKTHATPNTHESEVVNALEKLVKLRDKGLLTEQEFSAAKAKLLN